MKSILAEKQTMAHPLQLPTAAYDITESKPFYQAFVSPSFLSTSRKIYFHIMMYTTGSLRKNILGMGRETRNKRKGGNCQRGLWMTQKQYLNWRNRCWHSKTTCRKQVYLHTLASTWFYLHGTMQIEKKRREGRGNQNVSCYLNPLEEFSAHFPSDTTTHSWHGLRSILFASY